MRHAIELGAALYVPAVHPDLAGIARGQKLGHVRSLIFCTEDSIREDELGAGLEYLGRALPGLTPCATQMRFVRPRNPEVMRRILDMPGAEHLDGFVLPKSSQASLVDYLDVLEGHAHRIMPTLETREVFDPAAMRSLCRFLDNDRIRGRVLALRIGGNDLLSLLGLRRPRGKTLYQTPIGPVIASLVTVFKPSGFELTAPVFEHFQDDATLVRELREDLDHGLVGKTAIHPDQVALIEACYQVSPQDFEAASCILSASAPAVFGLHGSMCEPATHRNWAERVVRRAQAFGLRDVPAWSDQILQFPDMHQLSGPHSPQTSVGASLPNCVGKTLL